MGLMSRRPERQLRRRCPSWFGRMSRCRFESDGLRTVSAYATHARFITAVIPHHLHSRGVRIVIGHQTLITFSRRSAVDANIVALKVAGGSVHDGVLVFLLYGETQAIGSGGG